MTFTSADLKKNDEYQDHLLSLAVTNHNYSYSCNRFRQAAKLGSKVNTSFEKEFYGAIKSKGTLQMNRILYTIIIILLAGAGLTTDAQVVDTVCKGAGGVKYSIVPRKGSVYIWAVTGGNIIADRDSFIIVDWGTTEGIFEIKTYEITKNGCLGEAVISQILVTKESFSESVNSHEHVLNLNNPSNKKGVVWQKME